MKDEDGRGQLHLHGVDIHSKKDNIYTEAFSPVNAKMIQVSMQKNAVVIGLNHRNPHFHDLYQLDLDSGTLSLLLENNTYARFLVSDSLEIMLKMQIHEDGSWTVCTKDNRVFMELTAEEAFQTEFIAYDERKEAVYLLDNRFSNTNQLIMKTMSGEETILGSHPKSDVDEVLFVGGEPKAYASYYMHKAWHTIDPSIEKDLSFLESHVGSSFEVINQSKDGNVWVVSHSTPDEGASSFIYERDSQKLFPLYCSTKESFAKMYPLVVAARDGYELVC